MSIRYTPGEWRPMIFSAISIPGLRDGSKTETRRIVTGRRYNELPPATHTQVRRMGDVWGWFDLDAAIKGKATASDTWTARPRFQPGEQVYVCEAVEITGSAAQIAAGPDGPMIRVEMRYLGDNARRTLLVPAAAYTWPKAGNAQSHRRTPPYVPRWMARTGLLIEDVWPERLQQITDEGVRREGVKEAKWFTHPTLGSAPSWVQTYAHTWHELHSQHPWAAWQNNLWVWVYRLKHLTGRLRLPPAEVN